MITHCETAGTRGSSRPTGRVVRRYVFGIVGAAVGLVAPEPGMAQADGGLCATMHNWDTRDAELNDSWQKKHSSANAVMFDPELVSWLHREDKGKRENAHSSFDNGYVTNDAHPTCGIGGEV